MLWKILRRFSIPIAFAAIALCAVNLSPSAVATDHHGAPVCAVSEFTPTPAPNIAAAIAPKAAIIYEAAPAPDLAFTNLAANSSANSEVVVFSEYNGGAIKKALSAKTVIERIVVSRSVAFRT